jgi:copper(I)-binding protein
MSANSVSIKNSRPMWVFMLAALAVLSLAFVWRGAGRMMKMQTQAASNAEFAQLKTQDDTKIVIEVMEIASDGRIRGKLLEKQDETHYTRTETLAEVDWGKDTIMVMGKAEDIRAGAIVHVTGKIAKDRSVQAKQMVILTGYVQVK